MIAAGGPVMIVQRILGHATAAVTMNFCVHYDDDLRSAMVNLADLYRGNPKIVRPDSAPNVAQMRRKDPERREK